MRQVAVLFARGDSIYKTMPGCDVWDMARDARTFKGGMPIVGHPPCRAWGQLRHFAKPRPDEKDLARRCVDQIRIEGGVLEHPAGSTLWPDKGLAQPGMFKDPYGGWTLEIDQFRFGHKIQKMTRFYIVGLDIDDLPTIPTREGKPQYSFNGAPSKGRRREGKIYLPGMTMADREHTPPALAEWLVELARRTRKPKSAKGEA